MSTSSLSFHALQGGNAPATQSVTVNITGSNVAVLGAAYVKPDSKPAWLDINITGSGSAYTMTIGVQPNAATAGSYSSTFQVGTADSAGNILANQSFTVSMTLDARIGITNTPVTSNFIFGDTQLTQSVPVTVIDTGRQWTVTSDAAWLHAPTGTQSGNTSVTATIDATMLAPGTYTGHITATDSADSTDTGALLVTVTVKPATLTLVGDSFTFGGSDGRAALTAIPVNFSLATGQASYPFTVTLSTTSGGNWLSVDHATGTVGSPGTTVNLSVNSAIVHGGTYTGQVQISTTVNGVVLSQTRPVTFNLEANRIVVSAAGVGLSQIAGMSTLTRTVTVYSAIGRTDTPWTAASDSSWLTVTQSGVTGGSLVLTANPAGLPLDATQFANVTISSPDATVENQQTIRVGLFLSNTAPVVGGISIAANTLAASPVEPVVALGMSSSVGIYNVNSGALLATFSNAGPTIGGLVFSEDGLTLFVYDSTNYRITAINRATGAAITTYDASSASGSAAGSAMAVIRPNGYPMLVTPGSRMYDLSTGKLYTNVLPGGAAGLSKSPDQSLIAIDTGIASRITRSALGGGTLVVKNAAVPVSTAQGSSGESCFSASGDRIYTASGAPYNFPATSVTTFQVIQTLPGNAYPDSIQCVWNGLVVGGIDGYYDPSDIYVYDGPSGTSLGNTSSNGLTTGYRTLIARGLAVSADGRRLISVWGSSRTIGTGVYFATLPVPL
jgi:hypothetical protein